MKKVSKDFKVKPLGKNVELKIIDSTHNLSLVKIVTKKSN